jgi:hypothetical protein
MHEAEPCIPVGLDEAVCLRPTVEADAEAVTGQYAVHLGKGGFEPGIVVVVGDGAAIAGFVAGDVRRIGQDEVGALSRSVGSTLRQSPWMMVLV